MCYRVFSVNAVGTSTDFAGHGDGYVIVSDNDAMAMTDAAVAPYMPMNVTATTDSDTQITVRWESPADNGGAEITGYMVEYAYMMADGNMSDWMAVDPAHTGMEMMYVDMGLMPMTKYYYRVSAMNSVDTGMASDGMMTYATTYRTNNQPMAGDAIGDQTVTAGMMVMVQSTITDSDAGDMLTWSVAVDPSDGSIATAEVDNMGMVTVTGVSAGTATITVTAEDMGIGDAMMNRMSESQSFMVTVESANTAPTAVGMIADVTVVEGRTRTSSMAASTYFSDGDADDMLTYQRRPPVMTRSPRRRSMLTA